MATPKHRSRRLSLRPFLATVLLLSIFTAYSFLLHIQFRPSEESPRLSLKRSDVQVECSDVHSAKDQCAFVREHCNDDDAGLLHYLEFYYCHLSDAKPVAFTILVLWLALLFCTIGIAASDFFSINLNTIATILGLSESLAGVTFLAFGNGSPDVFSTFAAMNSNSASLAIGELLGAACFITGVVAGSMALVREFRVDRNTYVRDICFFIVAVSFTVVFLADGHLHFWECCAMIGYYVVYVITVVIWHWYTTSRKRRQKREGEARSHFYGAVGHGGDELAGEPYRDDPDEERHQTGGPGVEPSPLEYGPRIEVGGQDSEYGEDDDLSEGELQRMMAAEVASSMRVIRVRHKRSNTITPIRPSLVGALEFRSALAQLQRESNLQLSPMHGRSHSADHLHTYRGRGPRTSVEAAARPDRHTIADVDPGISRRDRALSAGGDPHLPSVNPELLGARVSQLQRQAGGDRTPSPAPSYTIGGNLAPPPVGPAGTTEPTPDSNAPAEHFSPGKLPSQFHLQIPSRRSSQSDRSPPNSPFPHYTDSPMLLSPNPQADPSEFLLPPAAAANSVPRESPFADLPAAATEPRPIGWWPYSVLPPPHVLLGTLFPTLQGWREKSHLDKIISVVSLPSIFLLVITLPVVDSETTENGPDNETIVEPPGHGDLGHTAPAISTEHQAIEHDGEGEWARFRRHTLSRQSSYRSTRDDSPQQLVPLTNEDTAVESPAPLVVSTSSPPPMGAKPASNVPSASIANDERQGWSRWLVSLQLFTGPLFAVFVLWVNMLEDFEEPGKVLLRMTLWTLLGSLVLLLLLLVFTSEHIRPKYHFMFCFLGFIISIAWISTIAGEVVGVLKTFGVILGISEALLGLTIFAAGNSVGDLVADITVARLGYPVMAL